jgi:2-haloacid dehalogenase
MDFSTIRALTFDVFGTVVDWRGSILREGDALSQAKGLNVDWGALADDWRGLYGPMMGKVRSGELPWTNLDGLHRMGLEELAPKYGLGVLSEEAMDDLNRVWHRLDPWTDVVAGLTRLKERFVLATLSNGNISLMVEMAKRGGLPWDAILGAEVAHHYKPDRETYLTTVELLGLHPEQCMMVAAHANDLEAAAACGMRTAYVFRPLEYGPERKRERPNGARFDLSVGDFGELADALLA